MQFLRLLGIAILSALLLGTLPVRPATVDAAGSWTPTASRPPTPGLQPNAPDTVVALPGGRVLVNDTYFTQDGRMGGTSDIYDAAIDRWSATAPFDPNNGRATPIALPDGRILFIGGIRFGGASPGSMIGLAAVQAYDPGSGTWTPLAPMREPRRDHTATLLPDGTVLVVSGDAGPPFYSPRPVVGVERYDPRTNQWSDAAPLARARFGHGVAPLRDGRVLVFGGYGNATAEVYDPAANRWTPAADLPWGQRDDAVRGAFPLSNGRVLAIAVGGRGLPPAATIYDPQLDRWDLIAPPPADLRALSTLPNGRILAIGPVSRSYDPVVNSWTDVPAPPNLDAPNPGDPQPLSAAALSDERVLLVGALGGALYSDDPAAPACFAETGFCIKGRFLDYWLDNGGLARNGFPIGPERRETLEDGREYTVQYFERVRLEHHPENPAPYDVLLGQFGRRVLAESYHVARGGYAGAVAPVQPIAGQAYFAETGHNLGGRFLAYWQANGGLTQFGYPITEERWDSIDGQLYQTQYFERGRFEYHPENAGTPYEVLLGQFGRRIQTENAKLGGDFGRQFLTDIRTQVRLGAPISGIVPSPGATLPFERGRMFFASAAPPQQLLQGGFLDTNDRSQSTALAALAVPPDETVQPTIYVLCGGPDRGEIRASGVDFTYFWRDTWDESQPVGGGPGPQPGLYEPSRGFGKVWRDQTKENGLLATGARDCLGYATTPQEVGYTIEVQYFEGGVMLLSDTAEGRFLYIVTVGRYCNSCPPNGTYERIPLT